MTARMMAGPSISSVSTFEKKRTRQTSQYGSSCTAATAAASTNDDRNGATRPAATMNTVTRRSVSKRPGASLNHRTPAAAINASLQLVMNSASTSEAGHSIPSSAARWAGSAASR